MRMVVWGSLAGADEFARPHFHFRNTDVVLNFRQLRTLSGSGPMPRSARLIAISESLPVTTLQTARAIARQQQSASHAASLIGIGLRRIL